MDESINNDKQLSNSQEQKNQQRPPLKNGANKGKMASRNLNFYIPHFGKFNLLYAHGRVKLPPNCPYQFIRFGVSSPIRMKPKPQKDKIIGKKSKSL
ncbi:hypothetical protein CEXT_11601 [Caerostris extrusa]|uniref:Uncharacterized protein n=1 Tax=Caerostris extrusa TaxID=172846 RepID=A0AAV4XC11_CAEEX|nr:hypothetical protein CEXT_11601 [Caerostris extrusa]